MSRKSDKKAHLLVEGKDDQHVIWALCQQHHVPEEFDVIVPPPDGGIDAMLKDIPIRLKESGLTALGIVVDADENLQSRWESVWDRFQQAGYPVPEAPSLDGFIATPTDRPCVGVWLMPDNQVSGMLENFVSHLIPSDDMLKSIAEETLHTIEAKGLNRYKALHQPKALIHTWLAWQDPPGRPMGQAITAQLLQHHQPLAYRFIEWLNRLFNTD